MRRRTQHPNPMVRRFGSMVGFTVCVLPGVAFIALWLGAMTWGLIGCALGSGQC